MIRELHITCPDGRVIILDLQTGDRTELPSGGDLFWAEVGDSIINGIRPDGYERVKAEMERRGLLDHQSADCDCDECRKGRGR